MIEILMPVSCNETVQLFPKGRSEIYLDTKCMGFFLKMYFVTIIITENPTEIILARSRGIRKCLPPVTPLSSPVPTSKVFHTGP